MRAAKGEPEGRVVIFPHGGAGPNVLSPLLAGLPQEYDVLGVTLPGRERRFSEGFAETPANPAVVVNGIMEELARLPVRPTVFFAHSMGVAVAVAVALADPGLRARLVLSAHPPGGTKVQQAAEYDDETLLAIIEQGGGTPAEILENPFWREYVLGLLRSDLALAARLVRQNLTGRLSVPLTVLGGDRDELVKVEDLLPWEARTDAGARMRVFPGGHFYLLDEANRDAVANEIVLAAKR
ncbi:alpha/beta fold hydrolase [Sphaerisporangium sp. NPDC088356]|uniref:thioesterase II family protein n=1 Tax=Sphaerisporangium sp. NPDC088356 TaxID=3154871 RepID=UPI003436D15C